MIRTSVMKELMQLHQQKHEFITYTEKKTKGKQFLTNIVFKSNSYICIQCIYKTSLICYLTLRSLTISKWMPNFKESLFKR